jgi:hypothetical protein
LIGNPDCKGRTFSGQLHHGGTQKHRVQALATARKHGGNGHKAVYFPHRSTSFIRSRNSVVEGLIGGKTRCAPVVAKA